MTEKEKILAWLRNPTTQKEFIHAATHVSKNHHPLDLIAFCIQIGSHERQHAVACKCEPISHEPDCVAEKVHPCTGCKSLDYCRSSDAADMNARKYACIDFQFDDSKQPAESIPLPAADDEVPSQPFCVDCAHEFSCEGNSKESWDYKRVTRNSPVVMSIWARP